MKIIITFFNKGSETIRDAKSSDYHDYIKLAFESAKKFGYETVLVTSGAEFENNADHVIRLKDEEPFLMNWILQAQKAYLQSDLFNEDSVLFSPDALIRKDLTPIFEKEFDVAFTERAARKYPINNGVIYLKPKNKNRLIQLWDEFIYRCDQYDFDQKHWFGDQKAIIDTFEHYGNQPFSLKVLKLPCELYNASILNNNLEAQEADPLLIEKSFILHFKGARKDLMKQYIEPQKKVEVPVKIKRVRKKKTNDIIADKGSPA